MKYEGFKEVKSIIYPNDYVIKKKRGSLLNFVIVSLSLCLIVAGGVIFAKYIGGGAMEMLNDIVETFNSTTP